MLEHKWQHFFKPEVRSRGLDYFKNSKVIFSMPSDTEVLAYIKGSISTKVSFKSISVQSPLLTVDCTCSAAKKGQFCRHIWATLLMAESKRPKFIDSKTEIEMKTPVSEPVKKSILSDTQLAAKEAFKEKQADYRKVQYQKQKQQVLLHKQNKISKTNKNHSAEVQAALDYFSENGFALQIPLDVEALQLAKKKLSRVFHPDKGGKHKEILELNKNFDRLIKYINKI